MRVHLNKPGVRVLGVAESFRQGDRMSVLAGVVLRKDLVVDGFGFGAATVGGDDATAGITGLYNRLGRDDVNALMVSGCIISKYNILDVDRLARQTGRPVVCLTYRETSGIERALIGRFSPREAQKKLAAYRRLGGRQRFLLRTGFSVYARLSGIRPADARVLVDGFTIQGSLPEPVRVAGLLARARLPGRLDNRRNLGGVGSKG